MTNKIVPVILFLLALNCFIWPANALNVNYYGVESRIQEDTTILNVITLTFNTSIEKFDYNVKYPIYNVSFESDFAPVDCETNASLTTTISCRFLNYQAYRSTNLKISFGVAGEVKKSGDNYEFSSLITMDNNADRFFDIIYLPPTATLATVTPNESFSPRSGKTLSDGRHIMVYWDKEKLNAGDDLFFSVDYRLPSDNIGNVYNVALMVITAFIVIVSLGIYYVRTTRRQDSVKVLMPLMKGDEKVIIDILSSHDGSVNQKILVRESDFSKAKVSRIVSGLKERGIVGVESMGRTNKVTLKIKK
jgi:uncharacterized membrane protein